MPNCVALILVAASLIGVRLAVLTILRRSKQGELTERQFAAAMAGSFALGQLILYSGVFVLVRGQSNTYVWIFSIPVVLSALIVYPLAILLYRGGAGNYLNKRTPQASKEQSDWAMPQIPDDDPNDYDKLWP